MLAQMANLMAVVLGDTLARIAELAGYPPLGPTGQANPAHVDPACLSKARALAGSAQSTRRLSQQDPTFHPWL